MSDEAFTSIENAHEANGPAAAIDALIHTFERRKDYHRLFDALLLRKKFEMGLPLARASSFDTVPEPRQAEFEDAYIHAARRVGEAFLAENNIPQAWVYLRTVREPQKVANALEQIAPGAELPENIDDLIAVALYERAHPVKGLELMLQSRGTCNTISAFDQAVQQISVDERARGAALLVRHLYGELFSSVCRDLERRGLGSAAPATLHDAIAAREDLFEDGNYHVDVSHLSSVVRFARFLTPESPEIAMAIELCEYGMRLSSQFQYPADPPFDEYYSAHLNFFRILSGRERPAALEYFRERLRTATETDDRRLIAYVLVD
jgi:hypothetical protein